MNTINHMPFELCLGHGRSQRHPLIKPYLLPPRYPVDVFAPSTVYASVMRAKKCIANTSGPIWWVGERKWEGVLQEFHNKTQQFVISRRWPAGMLTNFKTHSPTSGLSFPSLLVVMSVHRSVNVIKEANRMKVPIVGVVDTNANIKGIDIPVFANDDGLATTKWLLQTLAE